MRIDCPIIGNRELLSYLNSAIHSPAQRKHITQWLWERAYVNLLIQPPPGFFREPPEPPRVDPMKMNRRRQLRVPLNQQRPRDGCR